MAADRILPVSRLTRMLAIVLTAVLMMNQWAAAFAYEQAHGSATQFVSEKGALPAHDGGVDTEGCVHCAHTGHYHSHFLGHVAETAPDWLLPLAAAMTGVITALRIPIASLEAPYRPPRNPGFLRTV